MTRVTGPLGIYVSPPPRNVRDTPLYQQIERRNRWFYRCCGAVMVVVVVTIFAVGALFVDLIKDLPTTAGHAAGEITRAYHQTVSHP